MGGVCDLMTARVTLLRGVRGVHSYDPTAVLRYIASKPLNKLAAIPPTVLHGIADPAQVFYRHDGVVPHMREVCDDCVLAIHRTKVYKVAAIGRRSPICGAPPPLAYILRAVTICCLDPLLP